MTKPFQLRENDAIIIKDCLRKYRAEYRLGGDEVDLLRRILVFLGASPEDAAKERG